jgi:hypothetical protein
MREKLLVPAAIIVLAALSSSGAAVAQAPPPDEVARCRSISETTAQFACFHRLNEKMKRAAEASSTAAAAAPTAPVAAASPASGIAATESTPVCAHMSNPQARLSCYDKKWPPPSPVPMPPINN